MYVCVCACVYVVYMYMRVFDNTYMSSARTRVTRVRASVRIQRMVKMRELAREVRDSERTDERRPPPPAHRPSATQPILCHLKQKARFPLLVFTSALSSPPLPVTKRMSTRANKTDTWNIFPSRSNAPPTRIRKYNVTILLVHDPLPAPSLPSLLPSNRTSEGTSSLQFLLDARYDFKTCFFLDEKIFSDNFDSDSFGLNKGKKNRFGTTKR